MIDAPLALAFTAGMVATVNPCGFAMLPAYLTFFLGLDAGAADADARAGVARALAVGAVVTLGFVAVFTTIGALISHLSLAVDEWFPWMTIVVGLAVLSLGIALLGGFELRLALPHLERGGRERTLPSMFVFGVSYAVASLSCTLPVFLSVVAGTFSRSNTASGIAMYVCFALGMGLVLTVLTLALALARQSLVHRLRSALPFVNRVAGGFLVVAGAYFTWYGIYELRIRDDPRTAAGPVDTVTGWSSDISTWIQDLGAERLGLVLGIVVCAALLFVLARPAPPERAPHSKDDEDDEPARAG
ncbi:MAG TPA: cytochrome c biogenesis CcdA family protein [Acidimicrobiales bacterium]